MQRCAFTGIACAGIAFSALGSSEASALSTYKAWDGQTAILPYGCPDTTNYGHVITTPKKKSTLSSFSFWMGNVHADSAMVARGEVYAWDGQKARGNALWESKPRTIAYSDLAYYQERFRTGALALKSGAQFVLFVSIDKDFEKCTGGQLQWGAVDDATYKNGTLVFQNNRGDESQWTLSPWMTTYGADLVFKAAFD